MNPLPASASTGAASFADADADKVGDAFASTTTKYRLGAIAKLRRAGE